jgi:hypothetical protein
MFVIAGCVFTPSAFAQDNTGTQDTTVQPTVTPETAPAPPEPAPRERRSRFRFGPEVGVYLPTDGKTRDRFGSSWFTFGVAFGGVGQADPRGRIEPDIHFAYRRRGDDHVFMAPLGVAYRKGLSSNPEARTSTYVGASANAILASVRSMVDNVDTGTKVVAGGSVFAGVNLRDNAYVELRYRVTGKVGGFNLSGTQLSAGFMF